MKTLKHFYADPYEWVCSKHALVSIVFRYVLEDKEVRKQMCTIFRARPDFYSADWKPFFDLHFPVVADPQPTVAAQDGVQQGGGQDGAQGGRTDDGGQGGQAGANESG